jgi:hypothetical protein
MTSVGEKLDCRARVADRSGDAFFLILSISLVDFSQVCSS